MTIEKLANDIFKLTGSQTAKEIYNLAICDLIPEENQEAVTGILLNVLETEANAQLAINVLSHDWINKRPFPKVDEFFNLNTVEGLDLKTGEKLDDRIIEKLDEMLGDTEEREG